MVIRGRSSNLVSWEFPVECFSGGQAARCDVALGQTLLVAVLAAGRRELLLRVLVRHLALFALGDDAVHLDEGLAVAVHLHLDGSRQLQCLDGHGATALALGGLAVDLGCRRRLLRFHDSLLEREVGLLLHDDHESLDDHDRHLTDREVGLSRIVDQAERPVHDSADVLRRELGVAAVVTFGVRQGLPFR